MMVYALFPASLPTSYYFFMHAALYPWVYFSWNLIHPFSHLYNGKCGFQLPLWVARFRPVAFLIENHTEHHRGHGKSNFNITLPGADFLMRTFK